MGDVEYRLLGSLEVVSDGRHVELGPPKQRAVLAALLLRAGEIVSTDRLTEQVWGDHPPRTAAHSVQLYVSDLRKVLEPVTGGPVIETRAPGYRMLVDPADIDIRRFEELVAQGGRAMAAGDVAGARATLEEALRLWRGQPLAEFAYEEFVQSEVHRAAELRLHAIEDLAAAQLELGRAPEAVVTIETALRDDPLRERARELQMLALYRAGRHAEALRAYQRFAALLIDEAGVDPSPALRHLQERILLHDPTLAATPSEAAVTEFRNPYKGLRPFDEQDAEDFFGRGRLASELVRALASASGAVSIVGPSGCGKSSVLSAGLIPALRNGAVPGSEGWDIARLVLGPHPLAQLEEALERARPGVTLLVIVDQLEQVFASGTDERERDRFLGRLCLTSADPGSDVRMLLSLRADFYDRPLQDPSFAALFTASVVNVLPMNAQELEDAVVEPASRAGVTVEPALLAELIAETTDQPGALPLLQFSLTELFDRRSGRELALDAYRSLGGLRGLVSRRSETLYERLDDEGRRTCLQVFLRLVRLGDGTRDARRRTRLGELTALGLDPVVLSEVLESFGRHRLLTFDRDPSTGEATVELAHEALLWEWQRLAGWIERHREDLGRLDSLVRVAEEWDRSGRDPDYLIAGSRLAGYEEWRRTTSVRLAAREQAFLDIALERRSAEELERAARRENQRRLERRARSHYSELISMMSEGTIAGPEVVRRPPDVALIWEGYGDFGWNDEIGTAFDRATEELGLRAELRVIALESLADPVPELRRLSEIGVGLIFTGGAGLYLEGIEAVARENPHVRYIANDEEGDLPNVTYLTLHDEQGSFLAGAAAALRSQTGALGFIGALPSRLIQRFEAGYAAGARAVRPDVNVRTEFLYPGDLRGLSGYADPRGASRVAESLYRGGVDVIYTAAGSSRFGTLDAAHRCSEELGRQLWAIGVDSDEYETIALVPDLPDDVREAWRAHSLTSMVKRYEFAFSSVLRDHVAGTLVGGTRHFGLADGTTDITYSGGFIDDLRPSLDELRERIVAGEIEVPSMPGGR